MSLIGCNSSSSIDESKNIVASQGFTAIALSSEISKVQPMTGIVLWETHGAWGNDDEEVVSNAISLEYSYMKLS